MAAPTGRWNDARLDDLNSRVGKIEPVVTDVAVLKTEMHSLTRELRANTKATQGVADQMEKAQLEPIDRHRRFWTAIVVAVAGATCGATLVVLGSFLAGH